MMPAAPGAPAEEPAPRGRKASADALRSDPLAGVPIFASFSPEMRAEVAARATPVRLPAGSWLFHQGDPGDSLYVVCSGRIEILAETPQPTILRELTRGAAVGELALLTGSPRSASARARRDSELLRLTNAQFGELLRGHRGFALALTRELGRQLRVSRGLESESPSLPATIALLPAESGLPLERLCESLANALARWERVERLDDPGDRLPPAEFGPLLDRCERANDQVLLVCGPPGQGDGWTDFCLRQADRVVTVAGGGSPPPWLERNSRVRGCELLVWSSSPASVDLDRWSAALAPRAIRVVRPNGSSTAELELLARRLAGRSLGVVLSGGGARGLAHIGVLEELLAAGLTIDRIGGCSMGAFVGAMFAMGMTADEVHARCHEELVERNPLNDYTVPLVSLVRGGKARAMLARAFGSRRIEELPREFFAVSCDLVSGELLVFRSGPLFQAVGTSMALPGVIAPISRAGRLLVDGGVINNLPVEPMAATGEGPVIAVDVSARFMPPDAQEGRRIRTSRGRLAAGARRVIASVDEPLPSLKETITRAIGIGSVDAVQQARRRADLVIEPETGIVGLLEFAQLDRMREAGRRAAREALASAPGFPDG